MEEPQGFENLVQNPLLRADGRGLGDRKCQAAQNAGLGPDGGSLGRCIVEESLHFCSEDPVQIWP